MSVQGVRKKWDVTAGIRARLSENLGSVWDLLIRDRVSSTLERVLSVIIDMSAYLLVNIKLFYIVLIGQLSGI